MISTEIFATAGFLHQKGVCAAGKQNQEKSVTPTVVVGVRNWDSE